MIDEPNKVGTDDDDNPMIPPDDEGRLSDPEVGTDSGVEEGRQPDKEVDPDAESEESEESEEGRKTLKEVKEEHTPNVRLAVKRADEALPEGPVMVGRVQIDIPDKATQLSGFYTADASILVAQFQQYKFFTPKGTTTPSVSI